MMLPVPDSEPQPAPDPGPPPEGAEVEPPQRAAVDSALAAQAAAPPVPAAATDSKPDRIVACALDQGLVTTLTGYDTTGAVMKFGDGASAVLWNRFCLRIDNLSARLADPRLCSAQRTALSRRIARLRRRMTNAVSSAMHEYAKVLCKRYRYIFLPHFKVSEMVKGSPLGKRVSRDAMAAGHALLKRLLVEKGTRYGCTVMFVRTTIPRSACLLCVCVEVLLLWLSWSR